MNFSNTTILAIAHRLETIENYDRIAIVHNGKIQRIEPPNKIFEDIQDTLRK